MVSKISILFVSNICQLLHWIKTNQVPFLSAFVCLALVALMAFQINWLSQSRQLIEEQFDQKVNLAIGSTLSDYNDRHKTNLDLKENEKCMDEESCAYIDVEDSEPLTVSERLELEESLSNYMSCFGIDEKYRVDIFADGCYAPPPKGKSYCCSIDGSAPTKSSYKLGVSFASKEKYIADKMSFMVGSFLLIFFLLTAATLYTIWSLYKQKKITADNIDFFNNTAHELKTPLTNISLAINLLSRKHEKFAHDKYVQIIQSENSRLKDQIERVLFLSRLESGEFRMKKEPVNVRNLLTEVLDQMQLIIDQKQGQISLDLPSGEWEIFGDYYHLNNVVRNLVDNALKYCDKVPEITISMEDLGDQIKLVFKDNGIGISKADQDHIFEKFQRVNTGDIREAKGFGIGLSYVKAVIEMHKGIIRVESELNKGSQFELIFPNV